METWLIALLVILGIIVLWIIIAYNMLVTLRNRIENSLSQIDVQLKRRYDLIPNLVETVKGYAKHEKSVFENVTKARSKLLTGDVNERIKADDQLTGALKSLFAVAENYPKLEASENFKMLQEELSGTESKIAYARQFYNDSILRLNETLQKFPTNIIAGMFSFKTKEYLKIEEKEAKAVKVKF